MTSTACHKTIVLGKKALFVAHEARHINNTQGYTVTEITTYTIWFLSTLEIDGSTMINDGIDPRCRSLLGSSLSCFFSLSFLFGLLYFWFGFFLVQLHFILRERCGLQDVERKRNTFVYSVNNNLDTAVKY
jgi:hypothetical protein